MLDTRDISAADQQQLGHALGGRGTVNAPLPFAAGLGTGETYGAFAWRDLPGMHTRLSFTASSWFREVTTVNAAEIEGAHFGSGHSGEICFAKGTNGYTTSGSVVLGEAATGAHQSLLGSIFTTGTKILIASSTEATKTFTPAGLSGITKPCEINGFIFFTACLGSVEVVGYLPPPFIIGDGTFGSSEQEQRRVQHFATEHLGTAGRVGLWQGRIVVATTKGIWEIKPLSDGQGYGLGDQFESWNLTPGAQFAITHDNVWALDGGVLLRRGQDAEMVGSCGFGTLAGDGRIAVLSEPGGRFAVSNGSDFEEFGGEDRAQVAGTLLHRSGSVFTTERAPWIGRESVKLTTAWARFPNSIALEEILTDPAVIAVTVHTESGDYPLMRSAVSPGLWRCGAGGTRLKIELVVPVGVGISPPTLRLRRRTLA